MTNEPHTPESLTRLSAAEDGGPTPLPAIAVLGVGSMGGAILAGLRAPGVATAGPIHVTTHTADSAARFAEADDLRVAASEQDPAANRTAAAAADAVIVAVKPWHTLAVLRDIAPTLRPGSVVISVAAGITLDAMRSALPATVTPVRAMPNTPSLIGQGMTGLAAHPEAPRAAIDTARAVFETVGAVLTVPEEQMDALSAVSGSGPAYVFWFAEQLTGAARGLGLPEADAKRLAEQTLVGAANLLAASDAEPAELRRQVTSPNGTTERAIDVLQRSDFADTLGRALAAAVARAGELAAES